MQWHAGEVIDVYSYGIGRLNAMRSLRLAGTCLLALLACAAAVSVNEGRLSRAKSQIESAVVALSAESDVV